MTNYWVGQQYQKYKKKVRNTILLKKALYLYKIIYSQYLLYIYKTSIYRPYNKIIIRVIKNCLKQKLLKQICTRRINLF